MKRPHLIIATRHDEFAALRNGVSRAFIASISLSKRATWGAIMRNGGYSAWASGGTVSVPLSPGVYAVAIRTVKAATGQSGQLMELGRVVVS